MDRSDYTDETYEQPHVPPATAPVINPAADAHSAAELANDNGDSDYPGRAQAGIEHGPEDDDEDFPGEAPDEIAPDDGDLIEPAGPDEIDIERGGDTDEPGRTPLETPLPPD